MPSNNEISNTNKISPFVPQQVPEFVRLDHPTFVAFLQAYYEWLENQGSYLRNPMDLKYVNDVDRTFDDFIGQFKKEYLLDFPDSLAINATTGKPVEIRTLIKNIKGFYRAKGTEKTYEFLFRILYDTNVEFYYPKVDLLKVSDGKWIQKKTIRTTSTLGNKIFESKGRRVYQNTPNSTSVASASVSDVNRFQIGVFEITEITFTNINGTFTPEYPVFFTDSSGVAQQEARIYSVISSITISSGGSGYRVGDILVFTNASGDSGQSAQAKVSQVSSTGKILKIKIDNFGVNYKAAPAITIISEKGSGFSGVCVLGALCNFEGYYANNDGKLSSNKVIQDSKYYQNYSYVLKTEVVIDKYKEIIKRLIHPAGLGFFGQVLIKRCAESDLDARSSLIKYEVPRIGHYAPYTAKTYDDLGKWFLYSNTSAAPTPRGYDKAKHDPLIITAGNGNPISNGIAFTLGTTVTGSTIYPNADPFWIIYKHPNKRITGNVIAKIESGQKDEFFGVTGVSGWNEWQMTDSTLRQNWYNGFTGDYKYAVLQYTGSTEFRKITLRSFFNMPIGQEFDCESDNPGGIVTDHGANSYPSY